MNEERSHELEIKIAILETKLDGAEKALQLAQSNTHVVVAEIIAVLSMLISVYAVFHK